MTGLAARDLRHLAGGEAEALLVGEGAALRVDVEHQPVGMLASFMQRLTADG